MKPGPMGTMPPRAPLSRRRLRLLRRLPRAEQPVARARAGRDARHHRPERRRQDDDDGRHHRQDAARRGRRLLRRRRIDLTKLDEAEIANLGIGRKFQKPTVFEPHREDNLLLALKATARAFARCSGAKATRRAPASTRSSSTIRLGARARPRRRPFATARSNGSRSACCWRRTQAAAGRRAGRRHDRRRDRGDRRAAARDRKDALGRRRRARHGASCARSASRSPCLHEGSVLAEGSLDHGRTTSASSKSIWGAERMLACEQPCSK
jgi:hypothetical protein